MTAPALPRATPEAMGVPPQAIAAFLDGVAAERLELHSLMVFHRGHVIAEGWWAPYRAGLPHMQHSLTKSFTATAIGLAVAEGRFALDDTVVSFFPEITAPGPHLAAMTIRHLLTMSTGHATGIGGDVWRQIRTSWTDAFFKAPVPEPPGARMVYSSASSYMLSAILQRTTGERLHAYLATRLFEPLGIEGESWDVCPNGINPGGNGLSCRTEDMLKLALLHLQRGRWDGRQILPEAWVSDALRPHLPAPFGPDAVHLGSPGAEWSARLRLPVVDRSRRLCLCRRVVRPVCDRAAGPGRRHRDHRRHAHHRLPPAGPGVAPPAPRVRRPVPPIGRSAPGPAAPRAGCGTAGHIGPLVPHGPERGRRGGRHAARRG